MKPFLSLLALASTLIVAPLAWASPATDELFVRYKSEGAAGFDVERGREAWNKKTSGEDGDNMSCTSCHGDDLAKKGKHHKTGKVIEPLAPSANPERLTEVKKIEKWFKRNCNDVRGRECTAQEKGDFLKFLLTK